jgi:hypothetical protein
MRRKPVRRVEGSRLLVAKPSGIASRFVTP